MAIGIILGVAFGKIVASFIDDILMPPLGFLLGRVDFSNPFVSLTGKHFDPLVAAKAAGVPTLNYGVFFNAVFNFLIVAFAVFMLMRQVNRFRRQQATPAPPPMKECPYCCYQFPRKLRATGHAPPNWQPYRPARNHPGGAERGRSETPLRHRLHSSARIIGVLEQPGQPLTTHSSPAKPNTVP